MKMLKVAILLAICFLLGSALGGCAPAQAEADNIPATRLTVEEQKGLRVTIVADSLNGVTCYVVDRSAISCLYTGTPEELELAEASR